jgi:hypothetical protein
MGASSTLIYGRQTHTHTLLCPALLQETLNNLRQACRETQIMCAVMLDTKGPEIRTGFLEDGKSVQVRRGVGGSSLQVCRCVTLDSLHRRAFSLTHCSHGAYYAPPPFQGGGAL